MSKTFSKSLLAVALSTTVVAALSNGAVASAANVVPGADTTGVVVFTDKQDLSVKVNAADATATAITGTVTNHTDSAFTCAGVQGKDTSAGDVTTSDLVAKSVEYYRNNLHYVAPNVDVKTPSLPLIGQLNLGTLNLGSSAGLLQGLGSLLGKANKDRNDISGEYSAARVAGHAGQIAKFTVAPQSTVDVKAALPAPSSGARTDFDAAAFIMCTKDGNNEGAYVFAGYEEGTVKPSRSAQGSSKGSTKGSSAMQGSSLGVLSSS